MEKIRIKQVKSAIDHSKKQKDTLKALGLKGIGKTVEHAATPQIRGMVAKVAHLVEVKEL